MVQTSRGLEKPLYLPLKKNIIYLTLFQPQMAPLSSCSPPIKFIPLSDLISQTWPVLGTNRGSELIKESVFKEAATSIWIALIARQVNMTPYLFT